MSDHTAQVNRLYEDLLDLRAQLEAEQADMRHGLGRWIAAAETAMAMAALELEHQTPTPEVTP